MKFVIASICHTADADDTTYHNRLHLVADLPEFCVKRIFVCLETISGGQLRRLWQPTISNFEVYVVLGNTVGWQLDGSAAFTSTELRQSRSISFVMILRDSVISMQLACLVHKALVNLPHKEQAPGS